MKRTFSLILFLQVLVLCLAFFATVGAPAPAFAQQGLDDMKGVFGDDTDLEADTITMESDKDGKLTTMIAKGSKRIVTVRSKKMNLDCDLFTYNLDRDRLIAKGRPVRMNKEDVRATCENFEYYPKSGKAVLTGNPIVSQKQGGRWTTLTGEVVKINQLPDGRQTITIEGGSNPRRSRIQMRGSADTKPTDASAQGIQPAQIEMATDEPAKPKKSKKQAGEPVEIDQTKVDKIPESSIGGDE